MDSRLVPPVCRRLVVAHAMEDFCVTRGKSPVSYLELEACENSNLSHTSWRLAKLAQAALFAVDLPSLIRASAVVLAVAACRDLDLSELSACMWLGCPGFPQNPQEVRGLLCLLNFILNLRWSAASLGLEGPLIDRVIKQLKMRPRGETALQQFASSISFLSSCLQVGCGSRKGATSQPAGQHHLGRGRPWWHRTAWPTGGDGGTIQGRFS